MKLVTQLMTKLMMKQMTKLMMKQMTKLMMQLMMKLVMKLVKNLMMKIKKKNLSSYMIQISQLWAKVLKFFTQISKTHLNSLTNKNFILNHQVIRKIMPT